MIRSISRGTIRYITALFCVLLAGVCFSGGVGAPMHSPIQIVGQVHAYEIDTSFPYGDTGEQGEAAADIPQVIKTNAIDPSDSASEKIQKAYKIDLDGEQRATDYIKNLINWVLAIIGLVALTTLIYGFYRLILNTDNEEGVKKARKIVFTAVIALLIIGFAWIIVSQFFDLFFQVKKEIDV